jgi:hypothetical protein
MKFIPGFEHSLEMIRTAREVSADGALMYDKAEKLSMMRRDLSGRQLTFLIFRSLDTSKIAFLLSSFTGRSFRRLSQDNLESFTRLINDEKFPSPMDPPCVDKKLKETRLEMCRELLLMLEGMEGNNFRNLVAGDESWFTLEFQRSAKWSVSRDDVLQKVRQQIDTMKFMLTVMRSADGFHVVGLMTTQKS